MNMNTSYTFEILYPYELNEALNPNFNEQEQISNYTSLLSDKDRFQNLITTISNSKSIFDELIGTESESEHTIYIIRAELFHSCPTPLIIEYKIDPEKMILFLIKEIIKSTLAKHGIRCIDEEQQEELLNATTHAISQELDSSLNLKLQNHITFLHEVSKKHLEKKDITYNLNISQEAMITKQNNLIQIIEESYSKLY